MAEVIAPSTPARPPMSFGAWLGVVLLFLCFGIFVFVLVAATPHGNDYEAKRAKGREEKVKTMRDAANKDLNSYAWVDKGKGVARIPIDRAMQLTLRDLASKKPEPANPIASPAEAAAPGPSSAAPSAPAAQPGASAAAPAVSPAAGPGETPKPKAIEGAESENRNQPAAAANPPNANPQTQPGAGVSPAASASPPSGQPAVSPAPMPEQKAPGSPLPTPGVTPR